MRLHRLAPARTLAVAIALCAVTGFAAPRALAEASIVVEVESGKVLHADNATIPWYPASITKIMTAYATLRAMKDGRITLDTLLTVSHNAAAQAPVKMGFPVGTTLTVDNALKMMMVKSANDIAVVLAEGVGGSIEGFADIMNAHARRLGMTQSHFVNPNGLPADEQIVSARDMAILARAAIREFPEYDYFWHLPGIRLGNRVQLTYNTLIGRYPGADGMKTGFICASGFNLVATATRDGKRVIAVVLGASSSSTRAIKAAQLLEQGFTANPLSWLTPSLGTVDQLVPVNVDPPNLRDEMCGGHRKRRASEDEDDSAAVTSLQGSFAGSVFLSSLRPQNGKQNLLSDTRLGEPVVVYTGPTRKPGEIRAATTNSKSKAGVKTAAKPAKATPDKAGTGSWTSLSPSSLSSNPPPELSAPKDGAPKSGAKGKADPKKPAAQKKTPQKNSQATAKKPSDPQKQ